MRWLQILQRWLSSDRIRISPQEGQWLRLQVNQRIIWCDRLWQITARQVHEDNDQAGVSYHLVALDEAPSLRTSGPSPVIWDDPLAMVVEQEKNVIRIDCFCEYD